MENKLKTKVTVDSKGRFRCLCCSHIISKNEVVRILKNSLDDAEGKKVFVAILRVQKYLLEV